MGKKSGRNREDLSHRIRFLPAVVALGVGISLSVLAALWVGRWEQLSRRQQFQQQISNLNTALQRSLNRYTDLLLSLGDFYRASDNQVSATEFALFAQRSLSSYPGIQALEWAPRILPEGRSQYESTLPPGSLGITESDDYGNLRRARERPENEVYIPVTYIEPLQGNQAALGYDLASDPTRRLALERARDTGKLAATARIRLVQETADAQYSFLVFLPIYEQPASTPEERRQFLAGYVLGVFRVADVVEEALNDLDYDIDFYIYDQTAVLDQRFLGFYESATQQVITIANQDIQNRLGQGSLCPTGATCTQIVSFGQREWSILFLPSPTYGNGWLPWGAIATLAIGLAITGSLAGYLWRSQVELDRTRELSELKLRFFSMASHELRTPLSTILITAQSLHSNGSQLTAEQQTKAVDRIHTSARRITQLLDDILTLSRAEADKLEFAPSILDLEPFCQTILHEVQLITKTGQTITFEYSANHTRAYLDPKLMHSILFNLLSNAVKYSPEQSNVALLVGSDAQTIWFQVKDHGIGILNTNQSQVFEMFYRGENVGEVAGTGLGMAVVKTCVDLHNGTISLESCPGQGTTITVTLPRID